MKQIGEQGRPPDLAEEKTMLQFSLLGDPSIHVLSPVVPRPVVAAARPGRRALAELPLGPAEERRARRALGFAAGEQIRSRLPERAPAAPRRGEAQAVFEDLSRDLPGFEFGPPLVSRVVSSVRQPEFSIAGARRATAAVVRSSPPLVLHETFQSYWMGRKRTDRPVIDARMIKVETDAAGRIIRTQIFVST
jgi:hypothetical protein